VRAFICGAHRVPIMPDTDFDNIQPYEAASGEYEFVDQSPKLVRRMVEYFYTGDYEDCSIQFRMPTVTEEKPAGDHGDEEENGLTSLRLDAEMLALAEMYQADSLQSLAVAKYGKEIVGARTQYLLDSIPDVYDLTPSSVRALRGKAVIAVRTAITKPTRFFGDEAAADIILNNYDDIIAETPEFLKDLLSSYIHTHLLGHFSHCAGAQPRPVEPLQMKCSECGKGGARPLQ